jgi:hypothetical protein
VKLAKQVGEGAQALKVWEPLEPTNFLEKHIASIFSGGNGGSIFLRSICVCMYVCIYIYIYIYIPTSPTFLWPYSPNRALASSFETHIDKYEFNYRLRNFNSYVTV